MKKITAKQFKSFVKTDPAWASHLTEDVEITGRFDLKKSNITHLSKHLHFTGSSIDAGYYCQFSFKGCDKLIAATGNFSGPVDFSYSGIEEIKDLNIRSSRLGYAANFESCINLKIATGAYTGLVWFNESGVQEIKDLTVTGSIGREDEAMEQEFEGWSASFILCRKLKNASGHYKGFVDFSGSGVEEIKDLTITEPSYEGYGAKFCNCKNLKVATGKFSYHVSFRNSGVQSIVNLRIAYGGANFQSCKNLKTATGTYGAHVDFSDSGVEVIKDLKFTYHLATFKGCKKLKVDSSRYPNYEFRGVSKRSKREKKVAASLKKLQPARKKFLKRLRELGITRVYHWYSESCGGNPCDFFKGESEISSSEFDGDKLSYDLEMFFLEYTGTIYSGWTSTGGAHGNVTWDLQNDKITIWHCCGSETPHDEDYISEVVV